MLYLLLAILFSSSINIGLTYAKRKGCEELNVTFFNYIMATSIAMGLSIQSGKLGTGLSLNALLQAANGNSTPKGSMTYVVLVGIITGFIYLSGLLITQKSIQKNGPSPTTIFSRLGIVIPILASIVIWKEYPQMIQWIGIAVAFAALILYNYNGSFTMDPLLLTAFILSGFGELTNKFFTEWCDDSFKPVFFLVIFGTSLVLSGILCLKSKKRAKTSKKDFFIGMGVGVANLASSFFIVQSLTVLPATLVYPILCAGVILTIALVSRIFFEEKLSLRGYVAVSLTIVSLVLMNL